MKHLYKLPALAAACLLAAVSCTDNTPAEEPAVAKWEASQTSLQFKFGESRSISMTAENIDYVNVVSYPAQWTVTAVVSNVDIKAPSGDKDGFDLSGNIILEGVSRELDSKVNVSIAVSVDPESLEAKIEVLSDVVYTQVFRLGESKEFEYNASHVKDLDLVVPEGWAAVAEDGVLKVTAPDTFGSCAISGSVELSGEPLAGSSKPEASFKVALPAYKVDLSTVGENKLYSIFDEDGAGLGIVARQWSDIENSALYAYFVKDGAYTDAVPAEGTLYVGYDGTVLEEGDGEYLSTSIAPYTVKDIEGNEYPTMYTNGKVWLDHNYYCLTYPDGTAMVEETDYYLPDDNLTTAAEYGVFYRKSMTGATAEEHPSQGICPDGWHIPEVADFTSVDLYATEGDGLDENPDPTLLLSLGEKRGGLCIYAYGSANRQGRDMNVFYATFDYEVMLTTMVAERMYSFSFHFNMYNQDDTYYPNVRCVKDTLPYTE